MQIKMAHQAARQIRADMLCVMVSEDQLAKKWQDSLADLDQHCAGRLHRLCVEEGFTGRSNQSFVLRSAEGQSPKRIALVGVGPQKDFKLDLLRRAAARCRLNADRVRAKKLAIALPESLFPDPDRPEALSALVEGALLAGYRFDRYRSVKKSNSESKSALSHIQVISHQPRNKRDDDAIARGKIFSDAIAKARDLVNEPAAKMTPKALAKAAKDLRQNPKIKVSVLGPAQLKKERMNLFLAVAAGSAQAPQLARIAYQGSTKNNPPVVLVGKGITFDAGGLDIKSPAGMLDMKVDMAGAAAVVASMQAIAARKLKINVVAYLACAENMLGEAAYKPGDVIVSRAGLSVEVANTDAEGRLVMADTLSLAARDKPRIVVDIATLTGACMVALGPYTAGLLSNDQALADQLLDAGLDAGEDLWPLPLTEALRPQLKSHIADLKNVGGRMGGAITAGLFLREFIPANSRWAHLDIAGPATADKPNDHINRGGTGFGVATLVRFVERLAATQASKKPTAKKNTRRSSVPAR